MLTIVRNRTWAFDATIFDTYVGEGDPGNVPTNHTGWTIRSQIRTRVGNKLVANLNVTFPVPTAGTVAIRHEREFTRSLATGDYWWDIVATDPAGDDHVYVEPEPIAVRDNPTDPANATYSFVPGGGGVISHTHSISDVTGLQTVLDGKAATSHTHVSADITDATSAATGNTLVRRTSGGGASLNGLTLSGTGGSPFTSTLTGGVNFANRTLVLPDVSGTLVTAETLANSATITASTAVAVDTIVLRDGAGQINITNSNVAGTTAYASTAGWTYAGSAASAHRTALGLGTGDSPTFAGAVFAGHVTMSAANTYDIGGLSGTKPRDICADRILQVAGAGSIRFEGRGRLTCDSFNKITVINPSSVLVDFGAANLTASGTLSVTGASTFGGLIEQRNGTAAQESRIYGTYTGAGDYRRLALKMDTAGVAQIVAEGAGSGASANRLEFVTGGATRMTVAADGNVGIGTTSPGSGLHVSGALGSNTTTYDSAAALKLTNTAGNSWLLTSGVIGVINGSFSIRQGSTALPALTIAATTNNVGIGTTSPSALLDVNSNTVRVRTARTPASATAAGNAGDICWDADYIYVCTATNTWKRTAISTWP